MQKILAHRGASGYAPENTLEAFRLAAEMGADGVELDVHLTREGEVVVGHDETIDRCSNGTGRIVEKTLAELKGYVFNRTHPEYADARMPTLREVYALLKPAGLMVNVELKNSVNDYPGLEQKCIDIAAETGMTERVLYSSFNHYSLLRVKKINPAIRCGLLYSCWLVKPWEYAKALGVDALHPHLSELQVENECEYAHGLGILVNPWTVNEEEHLRLAIRAGSDYIITNYPDRARKVLAEFA